MGHLCHAPTARLAAQNDERHEQAGWSRQGSRRLRTGEADSGRQACTSNHETRAAAADVWPCEGHACKPSSTFQGTMRSNVVQTLRELYSEMDDELEGIK